MTITLQYKTGKDTLVPIDALATFLDAALKTNGDSEALKTLQKTFNDNLKGKKSDVWFSSFFLSAFGGRITNEATDILSKLKSEMSALEDSSIKAQRERRANALQIAQQAKSASDSLKTALETWAEIKKALEAAMPIESAVQPAIKAENTPPTTSAATPIQEAETVRAVLATEATVRKCVRTKKLYEAGLLEISEYLAVLVETKYRLLEQPTQGQTPPASATTSVQPNSPQATSTPSATQPGVLKLQPGQIEILKGLIATITAPTGTVNELALELMLLQNHFTQLGHTKGQIGILSETLAKAQIKKKLLEMATVIDDGKKRIDEQFLAAALVAATAAVAAWAAKWIADKFKGGVLSQGAVPRYKASVDPKKIEEDITGLAAMFQTGYNSKGELVGLDGAKRDAKATGTFVSQINSAFNKACDDLQKMATDMKGIQVPDVTSKIETLATQTSTTVQAIKAIQPLLNKLAGAKTNS